MREFGIALLLLSGLLKAHLNILAPWVPDLAIVSLILITASFLNPSAVSVREIDAISILGIVISIALIITVLVSAIYSQSTLVGMKLTKLAFTIFAFILGILSGEVNWRRFAQCYVTLSVFSALMFIYLYPKYRFGLLDEDLSSYNGAYLMLGDACVISLMLLTYERLESFFWQLFLFVFLLGTLLLSGARAPMVLFFLLGILWGGRAMFNWSLQSGQIRLASASIILFSFIFSAILLLPLLGSEGAQENEIVRTFNNSMDRLSLLTSTDKGASVGARLTRFSASLQSINDIPVAGVGFAAYGSEVLGDDIWDYPHNMFLEVWVESGFLSLLFLIGLIGCVYFSLMTRSHPAWLTLLVSYCLLNSLKSFSYADNRLLFFWLGVALCLSVKETSNKRVALPHSILGSKKSPYA